MGSWCTWANEVRCLACGVREPCVTELTGSAPIPAVILQAALFADAHYHCATFHGESRVAWGIQGFFEGAARLLREG